MLLLQVAVRELAEFWIGDSLSDMKRDWHAYKRILSQTLIVSFHVPKQKGLLTYMIVLLHVVIHSCRTQRLLQTRYGLYSHLTSARVSCFWQAFAQFIFRIYRFVEVLPT